MVLNPIVIWYLTSELEVESWDEPNRLLATSDEFWLPFGAPFPMKDIKCVCISLSRDNNLNLNSWSFSASQSELLADTLNQSESILLVGFGLYSKGTEWVMKWPLRDIAKGTIPQFEPAANLKYTKEKSRSILVSSFIKNSHKKKTVANLIWGRRHNILTVNSW